MLIQDPNPIKKLDKNATLAETITKVNEVVDLLNLMWFTDDTQHTLWKNGTFENLDLELFIYRLERRNVFGVFKFFRWNFGGRFFDLV